MPPLSLGLSVIDVFDLINPAVFHRKTFLSTQLISKKSHEQDVAILVFALIIVVMNQKKNHPQKNPPPVCL